MQVPPPPRRVLRKDGQERREAILDAALRVFEEKGLLASGIEDVRRAAGASPSSIYHQFGGIEDITLALLLRTFGHLFTSLEARVVTTSTGCGAVMALVEAHLDWVLAHRAEARFMYQAMSLELSPAVADPLLAGKAGQMAGLVAHFGALMARGEVPVLSPLQLDVVVLGVTHEACRRLLGGAPLDPVWLRSTLPALAWQSLSRSVDDRG